MNDSMMDLKIQPDERRSHQREHAEIACKVRRDARTRFTPGRTTNVSAGGAAIELVGPREARVGERVAIAFERGAAPVSCAEHMITAQVIRTGPAENGRQTVAVRFDSPHDAFGATELPVAA